MPKPQSATRGLPSWFWVVTGVVEGAVIATAVVLLVYYAVH